VKLYKEEGCQLCGDPNEESMSDWII